MLSESFPWVPIVRFIKLTRKMKLDKLAEGERKSGACNEYQPGKSAFVAYSWFQNYPKDLTFLNNYTEAKTI